MVAILLKRIETSRKVSGSEIYRIETRPFHNNLSYSGIVFLVGCREEPNTIDRALNATPTRHREA